jgi:hypothetical protein
MVNALNKKKWPGPIQISFNMSAGDLLNEALGGPLHTDWRRCRLILHG